MRLADLVVLVAKNPVEPVESAPDDAQIHLDVEVMTRVMEDLRVAAAGTQVAAVEGEGQHLVALPIVPLRLGGGDDLPRIGERDAVPVAVEALLGLGRLPAEKPLLGEPESFGGL